MYKAQLAWGLNLSMTGTPIIWFVLLYFQCHHQHFFWKLLQKILDFQFSFSKNSNFFLKKEIIIWFPGRTSGSTRSNYDIHRFPRSDRNCNLLANILHDSSFDVYVIWIVDNMITKMIFLFLYYVYYCFISNPSPLPSHTNTHSKQYKYSRQCTL